MNGTDATLIAATERVLDAHSLAGSTLELIAAEAGMHRVTLYRKGLNVESLAAAAISAAADEYATALLPVLSHGGSGRERLELLLEALCEVAERHLGLLASLYDLPTALFHLPSGDDTATLLTRLDFTEPIARVLVDGVHDKTLHTSDPAATAELIFNLVGWTYVHLRRTHGWRAAHVRSQLTALLMDGLSTQSPERLAD